MHAPGGERGYFITLKRFFINPKALLPILILGTETRPRRPVDDFQAGSCHLEIIDFLLETEDHCVYINPSPIKP
jgi:hypothetical protein